MANLKIESNDQESLENEDKEILEEARARFSLAEESEAEIRRLAKDDLEFSAGEQWPDAIEQQRASDGRPCLVINKTNQAVNQVTNDQRQNRPSIKVHPVDDEADIETAKVIQGIVRHIETNSNADLAYDTAFDSSARCGFGFWRVITDYVSPESFEQEILIRRIRDRFMAYLDPYHNEPDGSDAEWGFVLEWMSPDEYKAKYGKSKLGSCDADAWGTYSGQTPNWIRDDACLVAEYFYKKYEKRNLCLLSDGRVVFKEALEEAMTEAQMMGMPIEVVKERESSVPSIKWCKLNGVEVLEKTDWPGSFIPIVPVYGAELVIDGELILKGIVRDAKDPARMYNYWASAETEAIALAPRAPFIAAEGQLEGYKKIWDTANRANHSVLPYKPTSIDGVPVPPPQRNAFEPAVQAITQARMLASDDLKATTGIYDAGLGAKSNETSGVAISRRAAQGQTANYHLIDNLSRSIRQTGRIIIDLIPKIYDTARVARIIGDDGEQRVVKINEPFLENGEEVLYKMDTGRYDVTVDTGPSFQTKRQEAVASMLEMTRAVPQLMASAGDILVRNMDWPGAQDIAERIKKTLPPELTSDTKKGEGQIPPQVQAQMEQMGKMVEQLTGKVNELQIEKDQKLVEIQSKERIEMAKLENQATIELAKLQSREAVTLLGHQIAELDNRMNQLGFEQPFNSEQNFQSELMEAGEYAAPMDQTQNPTGGESPGSPMEGF